MQITAAIFDGSTPRLGPAELPEPEAGQIRVRLVASGICHTDAKAARMGGPVPHPVVLGHEGAGIVEALGAGVGEFAPGDPVVLSFAFCGACPACTDAEPAFCDRSFALNFGCSQRIAAGGRSVHAGFFGQSSFATHALVEARTAVPVPRDVPLELLGPLGCGIQTGAGAILNDFHPGPGDAVAVFGAGSVGLAAIMAARLVGADPIIAIDRNPARRALARELGASATGVPAGGLSVRFALDTTGVPDVMRQAIDALAPRGEAGFVTAPWDGTELPVPVRQLLVGRRIRGIHQGSSNPRAFIPRLIALYRAGRFPFDRLVRFYRFEEIAEAFTDMAEGRVVKPILRFG